MTTFALGTPQWRQSHNKYSTPDEAYQRGLESMLGPFAYQQQFGGNRRPSGNIQIKSPSVTPVNDLSGLLSQMSGQPAALMGPQRPANLPSSQGWAPPPQGPTPQGAPMGVQNFQTPYAPPYMTVPPQSTAGGGGGMGLASQLGVGQPGGPMGMRRPPSSLPQGPPQGASTIPRPAQGRVAQAPNLQQSAQQAVSSMFPEMMQGLAGYGQPMNFPMEALSQMATQAGQSRADMLGSQLDRDISGALAQLFQQGRQQQIGMAGDIGQFNVGLYGQQQQEQQQLARILNQLMLGLL